MYLLGWFCLCWVGFFVTSSGSIGISYRLGVFIGGFADFVFASVCVHFSMDHQRQGDQTRLSRGAVASSPSRSQIPASSQDMGTAGQRETGQEWCWLWDLCVVLALPSSRLCGLWLFPPPQPWGLSGIRRRQCPCPEGDAAPAGPACCCQREPG